MEIVEIIAIIILLLVVINTLIMVKTDRELRKKMNNSFDEISAANKAMIDDIKERNKNE